MKRNAVFAITLCLMMTAIAGGAASGVAGGLPGLPGYEDAFATANGTTSGTLGSLPGYQEVLDSRGITGTSSVSLGNQAGYREVLDSKGILGTTPSGTLLNQWKGMPGAGSGNYVHLYGFELQNYGGFIAQIACYYSTDGGVTWHESDHSKGISMLDIGTVSPGDLGVPEGALVKLHAIVIAGKDRTGSQVYEYHDASYDARFADYMISGTTWNPTLEYMGDYFISVVD